MDVRPTQLTEAQQAAFDAHIRDLFQRLLERVRVLLSEIDSPELQQLTYELAFAPSDTLPKRLSRPQVAVAHLTEQVYLGLDASAERLATLLQFAILIQEYYDILDDVVDGDVRERDRPRALMVSQLLMPLALRRLHRLGEAAVDYWSARALHLVESVHWEKCQPKSLCAYRASLRRQSYFFGFCTGLSALAAGAPPRDVERAEAIGCHGYQYAQIVLDLLQSHDDSADNWNITHFMSDAEARQELKGWRQALDAELGLLPEANAHLIRALFSLDLDRWHQPHGGN